MNDFITDLVLWALASPILLFQQGLRLWRQWQFWKMAYTPEIACLNCGASVSLVGQWQCPTCKWTYNGHVMRECLCGTVPRVVRCYQCSITHKLPELSD